LMPMRVTVNQRLCEATGYCVQIAPRVFSFDAEGHPIVDPQAVTEAADDLLLEAEQTCPTFAITVEVSKPPRPKHEDRDQ
jgi:ferredoxin